ncbi:Patatin-like serine hydrolase [Sporothrix schenckii 1099-18]|uniref:PNPLA domain-containing protein n=2 Tax=Sporothrix schenckii TaxID=29908 RepID=U7PP88_SPOS1|nr:Patatin-like serine hydrolase [Sporothrix schenckii 1099-18]ERS97377.1 hypothetical protein HMPREF1624_06709 [Sporothrix schenckii ATCC 58251]KJR86668.1 Patatin-like serine hydrolase [Sporothrix schenckii 1099-18]
MDSSLKRKDTTKGPPLRILSLDGGGVRGYSIFIILQEIMHRTFVEIEGRAPHRNEIPKPADHFDLIVGTGTGGLIALMLGRLRLDIETCKELYVRMTRMVFETDKTILGIPTRPTLFKASRLEDAIKEAVREHTVALSEGKDSLSSIASPLTATSGRPASGASSSSAPRRHSSNASVVSFSARSPAAQMARPYHSSNRGDPNALLYDSREFRTKTVVTAIYKGAPRGEEPVMLRSYDSRREPAPEFDCRIWEAGRATCAIGLAFKPIQIGQSMFHDDGSGSFNPSPHALDEATINEWPGRDVGVFVSVGTGKRPRGSDNNPMWYDGFLGEFAEARRRLISKIEGCENIHEYMQQEHLLRRGVNVENYYRLNVEVGVGEFGMNEWGRLAEISTNTKRYLSRTAERNMVQSAAAKLAKINRANERHNRLADVPESIQKSQGQAPLPAAEVLAVELPGDMPTAFSTAAPGTAAYSPRQSYDSGIDHLSVPHQNGSPSPRSSSDRFSYNAPPSPHQHPAIAEVPDSSSLSQPPRQNALPPTLPLANSSGSGLQHPQRGGRTAADDDRLLVSAPTPEQWRNASNLAAADSSWHVQTRQSYNQQPQEYQHPSQPQAHYRTHRIEPPPLPPKTPLPEGNGRTTSNSGRRPDPPPAPSSPSPLTPSYTTPMGGAPYPIDDDEAPPPPVNKARKPEYRRR